VAPKTNEEEKYNHSRLVLFV